MSDSDRTWGVVSDVNWMTPEVLAVIMQHEREKAEELTAATPALEHLGPKRSDLRCRGCGTWAAVVHDSPLGLIVLGWRCSPKELRLRRHWDDIRPDTERRGGIVWRCPVPSFRLIERVGAPSPDVCCRGKKLCGPLDLAHVAADARQKKVIKVPPLVPRDC